MKASDLFVQALESEGVKRVFGVPGEENLDLLESLRKSNIELIVTRHEQAAGFMAATFGRLTGEVGVCLSTLGPGATNLVTAAAYAQLGAMPMLMITGQKPIKSSKQGQFQIIDVVDMMRPLTKYTRQIVNGDAIPSRVREAFRRAKEERPGAVHLELPEDVAREETSTEPFQMSYVRRPAVDNKALVQAADRIRMAKHPLLVIGAGANRTLTSQALRHFHAVTGIPFITTQMGKGVLDERSPLFIGTAALSDRDFVHRALEYADLIINVGHDVVEKPPFFMHSDGRTVIHIHFSSAEVDPVYFPQLELVGDISFTISELTRCLADKPEWDFAFYLEAAKAQAQFTTLRESDSGFPIHPARVVKDIRESLPHDGLLTLDNGMYKIWFARNFRSYEPNTLILDNALATMGAGLPSAIAAKLVYPQRKVVAVCGDGGFMMNSQELETAQRLKLDLTVVVLNDNGYGMIKWKQHEMGFEDFGLDYGNPDFVKYAESYGAKGYRICSNADLKLILERCLANPGLHVIDVPVNYSENSSIFGEELLKATSTFGDSL